MVKPLLKIRYCFTCDRRLLLEIENTSRASERASRDIALGNEGHSLEIMDEEEEEESTAIFSIRCDRPYSFYFRGVEGPRSCGGGGGKLDGGRLSMRNELVYSSRETDRSVDSPFLNVGSTEDSFSGFSSSSSSTAGTPSPSLPDGMPSTPPTARESRITRNVQRFSGGEITQNSSGETDLMRSGDQFEAIQVESIEAASERFWEEGLAASSSLFSFLRPDRTELKTRPFMASSPPTPSTPQLRSPHSSLLSNSSSAFSPDAAAARRRRFRPPDRPTLVREVIPDGILRPGETRTFFVDVDDLDDLSRRLRQHPSTPPATFYLYYRSIGPSEKSHTLAKEWLEREAALYRKWQNTYIKKVISLEKKKMVAAQKSSSPKPVIHFSPGSFDRATPTDDVSSVPQRSAVGPLMKSKRVPHRIIPPALGCAVRWGVLTRPKHHPVSELIPYHAFRFFYKTVGGTEREMRRELGAHLLYEETHSKAVSGTAGKMFEGGFSRSRTAVIPLTSTAVGAGRDSSDSFTPLLSVSPSDHSRPPLSPFPTLSPPPPQRYIGPGAGIAMLEHPPTPLELSPQGSHGPIHRSTTTLDPATVEQLPHFSATPLGPSPSFQSTTSGDYGQGDSTTSPGASTPIQRVATMLDVKTPVNNTAMRGGGGSPAPPLFVLQAPRGVLGKTFGTIHRTLKGTDHDIVPPCEKPTTGSAECDKDKPHEPFVNLLTTALNALLAQFPVVRETLTEVVVPGVVAGGKTIGSAVGDVGAAVGPIAADGIRVAGVPLLLLCMTYLFVVMLWGENDDHVDQLLA